MTPKQNDPQQRDMESNGIQGIEISEFEEFNAINEIDEISEISEIGEINEIRSIAMGSRNLAHKSRNNLCDR